MEQRPQPPVTGTPRYLTVEQVAAMLQVSTKTVARWLAADPTLPALKIGGVTRFPRERLERWLRTRESGPGRARRFGKLVLSAPQALDSTSNRGAAATSLCQPVGHAEAEGSE